MWTDGTTLKMCRTPSTIPAVLFAECLFRLSDKSAKEQGNMWMRAKQEKQR